MKKLFTAIMATLMLVTAASAVDYTPITTTEEAVGEYIKVNGKYEWHPEIMGLRYWLHGTDTTDPNADPVYTGPATFSDVNASHWAYNNVYTMVGKGILSGMGDGTFDPEGTVTNAQFITMVVRYFYPDEVDTSYGTEWYEPYVMVALAHNLLDGTNVGTWLSLVNEPMNRYDMAQVLYNLLVVNEATGSIYDVWHITYDLYSGYFYDQRDFSASRNGAYASYREAVYACVNAHLIYGIEHEVTHQDWSWSDPYTTTEVFFEGTSNMTRAQAAAVLDRINTREGTCPEGSIYLTPEYLEATKGTHDVTGGTHTYYVNGTWYLQNDPAMISSSTPGLELQNVDKCTTLTFTATNAADSDQVIRVDLGDEKFMRETLAAGTSKTYTIDITDSFVVKIGLHHVSDGLVEVTDVYLSNPTTKVVYGFQPGFGTTEGIMDYTTTINGVEVTITDVHYIKDAAGDIQYYYFTAAEGHYVKRTDVDTALDSVAYVAYNRMGVTCVDFATVCNYSLNASMH